MYMTVVQEGQVPMFYHLWTILEPYRLSTEWRILEVEHDSTDFTRAAGAEAGQHESWAPLPTLH